MDDEELDPEEPVEIDEELEEDEVESDEDEEDPAFLKKHGLTPDDEDPEDPGAF
jgi:hypothetical protein